MTEVLVKIPDNQLPFFIDLLERLQFAEIDKIDNQTFSKKEFLLLPYKTLQRFQVGRFIKNSFHRDFKPRNCNTGNDIKQLVGFRRKILRVILG